MAYDIKAILIIGCSFLFPLFDDDSGDNTIKFASTNKLLKSFSTFFLFISPTNISFFSFSPLIE